VKVSAATLDRTFPTAPLLRNIQVCSRNVHKAVIFRSHFASTTELLLNPVATVQRLGSMRHCPGFKVQFRPVVKVQLDSSLMVDSSRTDLALHPVRSFSIALREGPLAWGSDYVTLPAELSWG
jgi:hypothetical protein